MRPLELRTLVHVSRTSFLALRIGQGARACAVLVLPALFACAQPAAPRAEVEIRQFQQGGYTARAELATTSVSSEWEPETGWRIDLKVVAPSVQGAYPVVLYLPGLGQAVDEGALWCAKWASAGYVVIAVQAQEDGRAVWQTPDARYGEFRSVAQQHFAPAALHRRLATARLALAEARRRAAAGDALLSRGDFRRVAIAGFDLGAQTALAAGVMASTIPGLRAVVALSPYETLARPAPEEDWTRVSVPTLVVTGRQDIDPYGLIVQATLRQAAFEHLPPGNKLELLLNAGRHETLSGNAPGTTAASDTSRTQRAARGARSEGRTGGGAGGRRGTPGNSRGEAQASSSEAQAPSDEAEAPTPPGAANAAALASRMSLREMAAVQSVTTAFLDSVAGDDVIAREWLARDAARYLRDLATMRSK